MEWQTPRLQTPALSSMSVRLRPVALNIQKTCWQIERVKLKSRQTGSWWNGRHGWFKVRSIIMMHLGVRVPPVLLKKVLDRQNKRWHSSPTGRGNGFRYRQVRVQISSVSLKKRFSSPIGRGNGSRSHLVRVQISSEPLIETKIEEGS